MATIEDRWTSPTPRGRRARNRRWGRGQRWRVRWTAPDGTRRSQACETLDQAYAYAAQIDTDPITLTAPPVTPHWDSRPLENGGIPGFSAAGYVLGFMRVLDPIDPLDVVDGDTMRRTTRNDARDREVDRLARAILTTEPSRP